MTDHAHNDGFLHDDSCQTCANHRRVVNDVSLAMLEQLREAMAQAGIARPWSPEEEWRRLLDIVREETP